MLAELTVKGFLGKVAGSDPVPGGDSIAALSSAMASTPTAMVTGLTVGKRGYEEHEGLMKYISCPSIRQQELFVEYIDRDFETYNRAFGYFRLPKTTDEGKAARSATIQEVTRFVVLIPIQMARNACELMEIITDVARLSDRSAITDACVTMMTARPAVLEALLNVRINPTPFKDIAFVDELKREACRLEQLAYTQEKELLEVASQKLNQ